MDVGLPANRNASISTLVIRLVILAAVFAPSLSTVLAQDLEPTGYEPSGAPFWERRGADLPKYVVVRSFFRIVESGHDFGQGHHRRQLGGLGITQGSSAERLLLAAALDARDPEVNRRPDLRPYLGDEIAFNEVQIAALRKRVSHLARCYYGLLDALENEGVARIGIESAVDRLRQGMVMVSTPTPDYDVYATMAEFEELENRRARPKP